MGTITITNLGKAYKQYPTRWSRLAEWLVPFSKPRFKQKWVLKGVTFTVSPGEAVGIIGVNGAGKSTLLKMITGTTQPTTGSVHMTGRVAAMLELGMGFHPDFTGRQNAYMAGQLLGYSAEDITRLLPEIEAFAEIGDYMDQPVRVYSSGMQMRLAFSVATAQRPDILIVDEALSVGDTYFVHKSFDRIKQFREEGTTLLIVSHDKGAIQTICDRAILLSAGELVMEGEPEAVMDYYNAMIAERENQTVRQHIGEGGRIQTVSGTGEAVVTGVHLLNDKNEVIELVNVGQPVGLRIAIETKSELPELVLGYMIKDRLGQPMFGTNTHHLDQKLKSVPGGLKGTYTFRFPANLGPGTYSISTSLHIADNHIGKNYQWKDLALVFNVMNMDKSNFVGTCWLPPQVEYRT